VSLDCIHQRSYCSFSGDITYKYGDPLWNDIDRGKPKNSEKNLPAFSANPMWTDPGANLCLRGERMATSCMSHAAA
jgi:hypothetical protein